MKKKGNICLFKLEMERDLMRVYAEKKREHLNRYGRICRMALLTTVVNSPARRFYTSTDRASRIINGMLHGKLYPKMKPLTREMYLEIFSRVMDIMQRQPRREMIDILQQVILSPAPKFYITPRSMELKILSKSCKKNGKNPSSEGDTPDDSNGECSEL